ncbi:hypothetical protein NYF23_06715 [SAR92 clade bacterium H455]|uniref:LysR substrate-binding domain-containing protein n=1 Tax=SAR92 clade bacterium H455 TaxID=2974818 RepID=A0ABY5TR42_9GAMM|nr:hypothetical protein NYF23_06715 [SAR92 clade bacterium H455]
MSRDDVDITNRGGYAPNERVQAVRLMDNEFIPVAAASYLAAMGTPVEALEQKQHQGLFFRTPTGPNPWLSELDSQWLGQQGIDGRGIMMAPRWLIQG